MRRSTGASAPSGPTAAPSPPSCSATRSAARAASRPRTRPGSGRLRREPGNVNLRVDIAELLADRGELAEWHRRARRGARDGARSPQGVPVLLPDALRADVRRRPPGAAHRLVAGAPGARLRRDDARPGQPGQVLAVPGPGARRGHLQPGGGLRGKARWHRRDPHRDRDLHAVGPRGAERDRRGPRGASWPRPRVAGTRARAGHPGAAGQGPVPALDVPRHRRGPRGRRSRRRRPSGRCRRSRPRACGSTRSRPTTARWGCPG